MLALGLFSDGSDQPASAASRDSSHLMGVSADPAGPLTNTLGVCSERLSEISPAGTDGFNSTAVMWVDMGTGPTPVDLEGPTEVDRAEPKFGDHGTVIETEIVAMNLTSVAGINVRAGGSAIGPGAPLPSSTGEVAAVGDGFYDIDSFFDVYVEIEIPFPPYFLYNHEAAVMEATIPGPCLPPYDVDYVMHGPPIQLYDQYGNPMPGVFLTDATHTPEPPRSIITVKLDEVTEEPLSGAVFTLHEGLDCLGPPVGVTATDATGVGDLGPMGGGLYSVLEASPPVGFDLPPPTFMCTNVDHDPLSTPYSQLEVIDGGSVLFSTTDYYPTNAKIIFDIPGFPAPNFVVLNGQAQVQRSALNPGPPDWIQTEIVSLQLTGTHPAVGQVTVTAGAGKGTAPGLPPSMGQINNVTHAGGDLTYGDSSFDVFVEISAPGFSAVPIVNTAPLQLSSDIPQLPPELDFFTTGGFVTVPLVDVVAGGSVGSITYTLWIPLPRGDLDIIVQDPPGPPEEMSFSIEAGGPTNVSPFHAAAILEPGPVVGIPCAGLGLTSCGYTATEDDLWSFSYGFDFSTANPNEAPKVFSPDATSLGVPLTEVAQEAACGPGPEAHADFYETWLTGTNTQEFDGDGALGCLVSYPLGLVEPNAPPSGDNADALGELPTSAVDTDGDDRPELPVYFTLEPNSPSLLETASGGPGWCDPNPCTSAHIFKAVEVGASTVVTIYATPAELGLNYGGPGDIIDGLCLHESDGDFDFGGDGLFDEIPDRLSFSLDRGSPTLTTLGLSPPPNGADQYKPRTVVAGLPIRVNTAADHGLQDTLNETVNDNLDAMKCPYWDQDGDYVPDPIDSGLSTYDDGTVSGTITGDVTVTHLPNSVQVAAGPSGGSATADCPATVTSDPTSISISLDAWEIAELGCTGSASVTVVNGPAVTGFGGFSATVPTGSKVIILQLPAAAAACPLAVPGGAYQITHSVGALNVTVTSPNMIPPVTIPPGSVYRDCDADDIFGTVDNCPDVNNPLQTNTDVALNMEPVNIFGAPVPGDPDGDACDTDDDNDSAPGFTDEWSDATEFYLTNDPNSEIEACPRTLTVTDYWMPDPNMDRKVDSLDLIPFKLAFQSVPGGPGSSTRRMDLNADTIKVDSLDLIPFKHAFQASCTVP